MSGDVPPTDAEEGSDSATPDKVDTSGATAAGESCAEAETKKAVDNTTTKVTDTPLAAIMHAAVDLDQVPGEVLRVGAAGSRSLSDGDDPAASVAGGGSAPAEEAGVPKPVIGDLAADVTTTKTSGVLVKEAPDSSSRGDQKKAKEGKPGAKKPSEEVKIEAKVTTKSLRLTAALAEMECW